MKKKKENKIIARKKGTVVSDKNDNTVVVAVDSLKTHPKYKKKYLVTKRYKVHDEENKHKTGDVVEIVPTKPMSKGKQYKII